MQASVVMEPVRKTESNIPIKAKNTILMLSLVEKNGIPKGFIIIKNPVFAAIFQILIPKNNKRMTVAVRNPN